MDLPLESLQEELDVFQAVANMVSDTPLPPDEARMSFRDWLCGLKQDVKEGIKSLREKLKSIKWWATKLLTALHFAAVFGLVGELVKNSAHMSKVQLAMYIMQVTVIGSEYLILKTGRWMLIKVYATWDVGRNVTKRIVRWLINTSVEGSAGLFKRFRHAFAGNAYKVLRLVGFACTILGIIATQSELEKARELNENDARIYTIFNRITFSLQIFEVVVLTGEIAFEAFGMTALSSLCGALGCVAGAVGIIVVAVYIILFAPDPWTFATKWLQDEGQKFNAYDPNKKDTPEKEPGIKVTDQKKDVDEKENKP